ncbi:transposase [Streptomyces rectiverticillatus]|nr:transposase [Streptomyces rectiverticillatus]
MASKAGADGAGGIRCGSSSRASWRFRTGSQWRDVPPGFGAWQTVCNRFAQWRDAGAPSGCV